MHHDHRSASSVERAALALGALVSLAVMAYVLVRMVRTGAHPVAVIIMGTALIASTGVTITLWRGPRR